MNDIISRKYAIKDWIAYETNFLVSKKTHHLIHTKNLHKGQDIICRPVYMAG